MNSLTGTRRLVILALRRDRVQLPVWVASLTLLHLFSVWSMFAFYGEPAERTSLLTGMSVSGVALMFNGLVSGDSLAAATMSQTLLAMLTTVALMSTLAVVRHTRQDEETGRAELVSAAVVGRRAPLAAALITVVLANAALGVLNTALLLAVGFPTSGSLLVGVTMAVVGVSFGALAAVTAQVASTARAANALAGAGIAVAFVLRGIGDMFSRADPAAVRVISSWPSWLSPLGWGQQVRPYDRDHWALLILPLALTAVLLTTAVVLLDHRDLGAGLLTVRRGRSRARPGLLSPLGLGWRLQRNVFLGWAVAMGLTGVAYGAMAPELEQLASGDATRQLLEYFGGTGDLVEVYLAATIAMGGLAIAAYTVQALLRLRHEETSGTLEVVLVAGVSRTCAVASHVVVVTLGTVGLLVLYGGTMGLAFGLTGTGVTEQTARSVWAAMLQAPAALALGGATVAVVGLVPRASRALAWGAYTACLVLGQLGELFGLPQVVLGLSPFSHLPAVPTEPAAATPVVVLSAVAAGLCLLGAIGLRRRDVGVA